MAYRPRPLMLLFLAFLAWGCRGDGPTRVEPTPDDLVIANCLTLQKALEDYAAENNGIYPGLSLGEKSLAGNTVQDLLPRGEWPVSPIDGSLQPSADLALLPGKTGYRPSLDWNETDGEFGVGYVITGFGESRQVILLNKNYPEDILAADYLTIANAYAVREAAERFAAENNGVYAANVGVDATPDGKTIIDFLPGGLHLENAFHGYRAEPVNGAAATRGAVGYVPIVQGGVNSGYTITAYGWVYLILTLSSAY